MKNIDQVKLIASTTATPEDFRKAQMIVAALADIPFRTGHLTVDLYVGSVTSALSAADQQALDQQLNESRTVRTKAESISTEPPA